MEKPNVQGHVQKIRQNKVVGFGIETFVDWNSHNVQTYASSIAFFFYLSLIPLIIILLQLLPILGVSMSDLLAFINQLIPESAQKVAAGIVSEAYYQSTGILSVSAIGLIWSASKGTRALRRGLNRVYDVKENRSFLVLYVIYVGYTLAMLVMLALMLFLVFADPVSSFLAEKMPEVFQEPVQSALSEMILIPLFEVLAVTLLYTTLPSGRRKFVRQLPGGILVTVIWFVFSYLFSLYVNSKSNTQTAVYGVLGTVGIFLLWLFCCFYILLIGAFFNRFFWEQKNRVWLYFRQLKKEHQKGKE